MLGQNNPVLPKERPKLPPEEAHDSFVRVSRERKWWYEERKWVLSRYLYVLHRIVSKGMCVPRVEGYPLRSFEITGTVVRRRQMGKAWP